MKRQKIACIYKITNLINQKIYIGSTSDYKRRIDFHTEKGNNKSTCTLMKRAFDKYGKENFKFDILRFLSLDNIPKEQHRKILEINEQEFLDNLLFAQEYIKKENKKFLELGYNLQHIAYSSKGRKEIRLDHKFTKVIAYNKKGDIYKNY